MKKSRKNIHMHFYAGSSDRVNYKRKVGDPRKIENDFYVFYGTDEISKFYKIIKTSSFIGSKLLCLAQMMRQSAVKLKTNFESKANQRGHPLGSRCQRAK